MPALASVELSSGSEENSLTYPGWRIAIFSAACIFVGFASMLVYTFGIFLKPLTVEFGWSRQSASAAFGIAALAVAACSPFLGVLLDRYPARRVILPCTAVFAGAFLSLGFLSDHLAHLYFVFLLLGIVGNGTAHLSFSRAVATWFRQRRGLAFAILMAGGALGAMVLPPLAQFLINSVGWRAAFFSLGGLTLLVGLPLAIQVKERRSIASHTEEIVERGTAVAEALRSRVFWIIVIVLFCASISQNGALTHLPALLTDRGISASGAALATSVMGGAILSGRLLTGWLLDRYFAPRVAFLLLSTAAVGVLVLAGAQSLVAGIAGASLIGLGMGGEADVTPYLLTRYFGLKSFSTLYGFTWTAYAIAGATGPVIMGKAFDSTGSYQRLLVELATLTAATAGLMLLLPRYSVRIDSLANQTVPQ